MAQLQRGRILHVHEGAAGHQLAQAGDAICGHGMAAHERILVGGGNVFLLGEVLEGLEHAPAGLPGGLQELDACLVGGRFLRAALAQQRAHDHLVAAHHHAAAEPGDLARVIVAGGCPTDHQADAQHGHQQRLGLVARDAVAQRRHVPAGDVAGLVRDHADDLVGRLGLQDGAGVQEHVEAVDHERVEALVADDAHGDVAAEPCRLEDRPRVVLQQVLDLGVADEGNALGRCRQRCADIGEREERMQPDTPPGSGRTRNRPAGCTRV